MSDSSGSTRRVFWAPRTIGSVRSSVPKPRNDSPLSGLPGSSNRSGRPISRRRRPPRSKTRKGLAVWDSSQRGKGTTKGSTPLSRVSSGVGGGTVLTLRGLPSGP